MESQVRNGEGQRGGDEAIRPPPAAAETVDAFTIAPASEPDADGLTSGIERKKGALQQIITHLPSPMLTASDPPERTVESNLPRERAVSSPTNGVPTPDPSSDSNSDADLPGDFISSDLPAPETEPQPQPPPPIADDFKTRSRSSTKSSYHDGKRRLSASKIQELTAAPESLPIASIPDRQMPLSAGIIETSSRSGLSELSSLGLSPIDPADFLRFDGPGSLHDGSSSRATQPSRPGIAARTLSTPPTSRRKSTSQPPTQPVSTRRNSFHPLPRPTPLDLDGRSNFPPAPKPPAPARTESSASVPGSPILPSIPLPPMSIPTLLQLELSGQRPSPLYIHHSYTSDLPYESSAIKLERLKNVLVLPWFLERAITFGALACLDAWLWTFTVLPMRFCIAISVLVRWWGYIIGKETRWLVGFVWGGIGRLWRRARRGRPRSTARSHDSRGTDESRSRSRVREPASGNAPSSSGVSSADPALRRRESSHLNSNGGASSKKPGTKSAGSLRHRRTKSSPSNLTSFHKADLLQGAIIICSSMALMNLDASRMYHFIRAQSAIKLYAIYNLLEVGDRLLSALGQDIFECLFSTETLSRNSSGRSKIMLPFGMFLLALVYNIMHAVVLFYQVIALNVAVNSYSNALLTLLLTSQFVEIKSTVFKRFEKENTFQLACADIVERFQLWIVLLIIGMRNVVEVGGLYVPGAGSEDSGPSSFPLHSHSVLPASFTILPSWLWSGEVLSPFIVVIGSEMIVDWIKHAYVNKFNNIKPNFYGRILDILCKDYYTNAFVTPSLTRRLGLPLLPLSCLFIRATVQIYNMFLATHVPTPLPPSTHTSLSVESATPSPAMAAALDRLDNLIRNALGRAVYGFPYAEGAGEDGSETAGPATRFWMRWSSDDVIAAVTMVVVFLLIFLVLLIVKLVLGMVLLRYSRDRYAKMKTKEHAIAAGAAERESFDTKGKRVGGYGQIEVGDDRRRWIFADDPKGLQKIRDRDKRTEQGAEKEKEKDFSHITRYEMVARRIW
ncbi:eukaryotic membrane protein family-domain-containing protein [Podospora didyma]|uniref:Eukaryotic membrane protein family-domain-containing protein n=1 Tax=Podospora didyma TaxID=330526 RepID=A0AAE0TVN9_9PEZI|nr:eukaryotic membrane protein family-domain-containing protein [Podospora didyma]